MNPEIKITAEPKEDIGECKFTVDRPVYPGGSYYFGNRDAAKGSPLAEKIFGLKDVTAVLVSENIVKVSRDGFDDWLPTAKAVGGVIRECLNSGIPLVDPELKAKLPSADVIRERVQRLFDEEINPAIAGHGGFVDVLDVKGTVVYLRMGGGCQGCGAADVTLKQGIERLIRDRIPEVGEILDTTDHASGRNPYYSSGKG